MSERTDTLLRLVTAVLEQADRPLTPIEVWKKAKKDGLDSNLRENLKKPRSSIRPTLHAYSRGENAPFIKQGRYPARFFLKVREHEMPSEEKEEELNKEEITLKEEKSGWKEEDLNPLLAYFAHWDESFNRGKNIYTKVIPHQQSEKKGYSKWVYPDIVGFYLPVEDYKKGVIGLNTMLGDNLVRFYSFELKKFIHRGNYCEAFFQAVSNSSWANEGYLVTAEIKEDEDLLSELSRLSESFGIGVITLDIENIESSQVVFPATPKDSIGWETMNKIFKENEKFSEFVQNVQDDFKIKKINPSNYENVNQDSLEVHMEKHFRTKTTSK